MTTTQFLKNYFSIALEYNACWEDFQIIQKALRTTQNDTVLSISSAGDNVLNLLLDDPRKIMCVDYNPYQNFLLELKVEAIRNLGYQEFLEILGVSSSDKRRELYHFIRRYLHRESRLFWDTNVNLITEGIIYTGEPNVKAFGKFMRFLKGRNIFEDFFKCETIDKQAEYFYENICGFPWYLFLKLSYNIYYLRLELCTRLLVEFLLKKKRPKEY